MALTDGALSPDLFRRWSAIALVAGALERRVWIRAGAKVAYPNLFVLLVAPPGVGKYIIEEVRELWNVATEPGSKIKAFHVAPDSMTKASLMDTLAKARQTRLTPTGPALTYHSLLVAAEEFGVLLPDYDQAYIHTLNSVWNNKSEHREVRRTGTVKDLIIENPQLNILGGVQPAYLASTFPEEAWSTGLARRIIMIYSSEPPAKDLFYEPPDQDVTRALIVRKLGQISQLFGQAKWEPDAAELISGWHSGGRPPVPSHSKLVHYNQSRSIFIQKLALVSAVARTGHLILQRIDVERAMHWLFEAEGLMPDVFREMVGKSDSQVIEELHYFVTAVWAKDKGKKAVSGRLLYNFLSQRVPSEKVERIIAVAERANIIARVAGTQDQFVPRPRHEHGME